MSCSIQKRRSIWEAFGFDYVPSDSVSLGASYGYEKYTALQASRTASPLPANTVAFLNDPTQQFNDPRRDMRIMTYGTDGIARQTGYFIYDLWDINAGLTGGHLTLDNVTSTDIFCGSQVVLPQGGQVFLAGGDNWTGTGTTNTGNNNSNVLTLSSNVLARGNNMNRARWYSGSTVRDRTAIADSP